MLYIQVDVTLKDHPKTKKLARLLGVSRMQAVGHLVAMWSWAAQYAPDGDLTNYRDEPDAIADGALWEGDPVLFVNSLLNARVGGQHGFLEDGLDGSLLIHDWYEYFGRVIERRRAEAERKRVQRETTRKPAKKEGRDVGQDEEQGTPSDNNTQDAPESVRRTSAGHPTDVPRKSSVNLSNLNVPNPSLTELNQTNLASSMPGAGGNGAETVELEEERIDPEFHKASEKWKETFRGTSWEMAPPYASFYKWLGVGGLDVLCYMIEQAKGKGNPGGWLYRTYENWRESGQVAQNVIREVDKRAKAVRRPPVTHIIDPVTRERVEVGDGA